MSAKLGTPENPHTVAPDGWKDHGWGDVDGYQACKCSQCGLEAYSTVMFDYRGELRQGASGIMKPWHMRIGRYGRAFVPAPGPVLAVVIWLRGWRPFESLCVSRGRWWSKPSRNTAAMYPIPHAIWWDGNPRRTTPGKDTFR